MNPGGSPIPRLHHEIAPRLRRVGLATAASGMSLLIALRVALPPGAGTTLGDLSLGVLRASLAWTFTLVTAAGLVLTVAGLAFALETAETRTVERVGKKDEKSAPGTRARAPR